jgi:hypothetical protein
MVLQLSLKRSYRLASLLGLAHAGAAAATWLLDVSLWARALLLVVIAASLWSALRRHALLVSREAAIALELGEDGSLNVKTRSGAWHGTRVLPSTFVTPLLTVLNLGAAPGTAKRHVVIMGDSLPPEDYRELRVRLRWGRTDR